METPGPVALASVLRGLRRPSLAEHDVTHEFLEAGRDLLRTALAHGPADEDAHPFLRWMSRQTVVEAVTARGRIVGTEGYFRDRWDRHRDYVNDLIAWIRHQRPQNSFPERADDMVAAALASETKPSLIVRILARRNMLGVFENPLFGFQLVALAVVGARRAAAADAAADPADEHVVARDVYTEVDKRWSRVICEFLDARGVSLRPGIEVDDLVAILVAVGEGLALRELAWPTDGHARERRASFQGLVALALLAACADTDGRSLDDAVDELFSSRAR